MAWIFENRCAAGELMQQLAREAALTAAHDVGDGGIGVALAEMALAGGIGCTVRSPGAATTRPSSERIRGGIS